MGFIGRLFRRGSDEPPGDEPPEQGLTLPGSETRFLPAGEERIFREMRTLPATDPRTGRRVFRSGVGISTTSAAEARQIADEQARRALEDVLAGRSDALGGYAYFADRRAEPLVDVVRGPSGDLARITVNGYGAVVMNATSALFADVDTDDRGPKPPSGERQPARLSTVLARHPEMAMRAYRTRAGWRYLCTNRTFDPAGEDARDLLEELGADARFILLCRAQRSFRARLTPKPWRAGQRALPSFAARAIDREDLQRLVDRTWKYATTRYVERLGPDETLPELRDVVEYHDRWTQAMSSKPLA
jgi:hypothetical protein